MSEFGIGKVFIYGLTQRILYKLSVTNIYQNWITQNVWVCVCASIRKYIGIFKSVCFLSLFLAFLLYLFLVIRVLRMYDMGYGMWRVRERMTLYVDCMRICAQMKFAYIRKQINEFSWWMGAVATYTHARNSFP